MKNDTKLPGIEDMTEQQDIPAGCFSSWLRRTRSALIKGSGAEVHCGECKACCRSSYFIHIKPEETQTISRINRKLLFPAPGLPKGNVVMGYNQHGLSLRRFSQVRRRARQNRTRISRYRSSQSNNGGKREVRG